MIEYWAIFSFSLSKLEIPPKKKFLTEHCVYSTLYRP